jgi:transcriptional regulator with XRE-family HTH domain
VDDRDIGAMLKTARQAAGLSLSALASRTYYSKGYLGNVECGKRRATPELVQAYEQALGDDVERRNLLLGMLAGVVTPTATAEALAKAFEAALSEPRASVDDWLGKTERYGVDYMSVGAGDMQARLASDLIRLRQRLDNPQLCAVAARLLTVHGKTMPSANGDRSGAIRWYNLGASTADRSRDRKTQVWTRGRAALALAYEGAELPVARRFAADALSISDHPSGGRLNALLALMHVQGLEGDTAGALATRDQARRVAEAVDEQDQISDFAIPEWRFAIHESMLFSRLGYEHRAIAAQETTDRTRPASLPRFGTHVELHRGLMMATAGDKPGGIAYARAALAKLPPEKHSLSLRLMMDEIEAA